MHLSIHSMCHGRSAGGIRFLPRVVLFFGLGVVLCARGWAGDAARSEAKLPADIYPASAFAVPVTGSAKLQQALDAHRAVRLMPGDYGPGPVTLRSGQQLYGLPGTKLGQIVIEPGATGALVSGVQGNVVFPASDKVTRGNTMLRIYGAIVVQGGSLEENLFVDSRAVDIDVTAGGYLRNNRFIRAPGQLQGHAMLKFRASPDRPSTGNVFLWMNSGGNEGPTTDISGVPELTIAVVDAEMWSFKMKEATALFITGPMQRLNLFAVQGGRYDADPELRKQFGLVDSAAKEVRVYGLTCSYRGQAPDTLPAKIVLQEGNERSLFADCLHYSYSLPSTNILNVRAFERPLSTAKAVPTPVSTPDADRPIAVEPAGAEQTQQAALKDMILQTGREIVPWERPVFDAAPDPAGENWARNVRDVPDQTQMIQGRLDKEGMVVLPAGKYYISAPLRINRNKGLIGAGMNKTVIIAKDPDMSMFIYDAGGKTGGVTLANLTLQGGRVGVHLRGGDIVERPLSYSFLSHITFRSMSEAGVYVDMPGTETTSFDNNLISFCNFVECGSGLKQRAATQGGWGFIDKLVVYRCQFLQCGMGIDFPAGRTNNACSYIECLFKGNTMAAAKLMHNATASFANCDFIDNAGNPVVDSDDLVYFISCHFQTGGGALSLLPSRSCTEGCVFEPGTSVGAVIVKDPSQNHFYNCTARVPTGQLKDALLLNNEFAGQADLSQVAAYVRGGSLSVLVPGVPQPGPQILVTGIPGQGAAPGERK